MIFTRPLRERIRSGRIRCTVRIWLRCHVKVGGRYQMDDGHVVVDSITEITIDDITDDLARESGFESVEALLGMAKHGRGDKVFLIRFHYLPPGAWHMPVVAEDSRQPAGSARQPVRTNKRRARSV